MDSPFDTLTETQSPTPAEPVVKQGGSVSIGDDEIDVLTAPETDKKESAKRDLASKIDKEARGKREEKDSGKKAAKEIEKENKDKVDEAIKAIKKYQFKKGDQSLELDEDFEFTHKIDGKVESFKVKDLLNDFAGKTDWTRKYNALHQERTGFYKERDSLHNNIQEFYRRAVEDKNPRLAIDFLAETMGADPKQVWTDLVNQIKGAIPQGANLTPEEMKAKELEQELEYLRSKEDLRRKEAEKSKTDQELIGRIKETQSKYGMTPEQFKACYDDMVAEAARTGYDVKNLTPEQVGQYYQILNKHETIAGLVAETTEDSELADKIKVDLYDVWKANPQFTAEDLKDIAISVYGSPKKSGSRLAEKVKKQETKKTNLPQQEPLLSWDDL